MDYILFTDRSPEECPGWEVRTIGYDGSRRQRAKHPKMFFHGEGHDWIVYMDARFTPKAPLRVAAERFTAESPWTVYRHPWRGCAYAEAHICAAHNLADRKDVGKWLKRLKDENYPVRNGLVASGIIFRRDTPEVRALCELWWECLLQVEGERDQISFDYACWAKGFNYKRIDKDIYEQNEWFHVRPHTSKDTGRGKR